MTRFWVEISALDHGHGGPGWELGTCLWSPSANRDGHDRYALMREPDAGDVVFHIIKIDGERALAGVSNVVGPVDVLLTPPPVPGAWAGFDSYYRIPLSNFLRLEDPTSMREIEAVHADAIRADIFPVRPHHHPYSPYREGIRVTQGLYLGLLTSRLIEIFAAYADVEVSEAGAKLRPRDRTTFTEGEQCRSELAFFARNPELRTAAIAEWGAVCNVCGFDFSKSFGELGAGYIEVHHLEPMAAKALALGTSGWSTTVDDVRPLCANCHRMAHRCRPPVPLDELRRLRDQHIEVVGAGEQP